MGWAQSTMADEYRARWAFRMWRFQGQGPLYYLSVRRQLKSHSLHIGTPTSLPSATPPACATQPLPSGDSASHSSLFVKGATHEDLVSLHVHLLVR